MLTLSSHPHLPTADDASARGPTAQRPASYMFVASDPCTSNNKPNRTIRSFVMKATRGNRSWSTATDKPRKKKVFKKNKTTLSLDDQRVQHFRTTETAKAGPSKSHHASRRVKVERRSSDEDHLFKSESPTASTFGSIPATNGAPITPYTESTDFGSTPSSSTFSNFAPYTTPDFTDDATLSTNYITPNSQVFTGGLLGFDLGTSNHPSTSANSTPPYETWPNAGYYPVNGEVQSSYFNHPHTETWAGHDHTQDESPSQQLMAQASGYPFGLYSYLSDPAANMPLSLTHDDTLLLNTFFATYLERVNPLDIHKHCIEPSRDHFSRCMQSPSGKSFINTMLYASQLRLEILHGQKKIKSDQYRMHAISALSEDVGRQQMNGGPVDDTMIATVQMLYNLADAELANSGRTGNDDIETAKGVDAHRTALERLIQSKGGLSGLRGNRCLYTFIIMDSMARAIATFTEPYATPIDENGNIETYTPVSNDKIFFLPYIISPLKKLDLGTTLIEIIDSLAFFIPDLNLSLDNRMHFDPFDLQKYACIFMYRFYNWHETHPHASPMERSLCLALLIFIINITEPDLEVKNRTLVQSNAPCPRISRVVTKLHDALQEISIEEWSEVPQLRLWVVTMCGLGAYRLPSVPPEVLRFCEGALKTPNTAITHTTETLLSTIRMWLWVPVIFEKKARKFWIDLGLCSQEVVDVSDVVCGSSMGASVDESVKDEHLVGRSTDSRFLH